MKVKDKFEEFENIKSNFLNVIEEISNIDKTFSAENERAKNIAKDVLNSINPQKIYFIGAGGSGGSLYSSNYIVQHLAKKTYSWLINPNEFLFKTPENLDENTLVIGASHSGSTSELIEAVKLAKEEGCYVIGLTAGDSSNLEEIANLTYLYSDKVAAVAQPLAANLLVLNLLKETYEISFIDDIIDEHVELPKILKSTRDKSKKLAKEAAKIFENEEYINIVGSGMAKSMAYHLAVIGLPEFSWVKASYLPGEDFFHGPLEIVEENLPMLFFLDNNKNSRALTKRIIDFADELNTKKFIFDMKDIAPESSEYLTLLLFFMVERWFIYFMGMVNDHNPDNYRYMGVMDF